MAVGSRTPVKNPTTFWEKAILIKDFWKKLGAFIMKDFLSILAGLCVLITWYFEKSNVDN